MRIPSTLVWEAEGEPRRDEILLTDEAPNGSRGRVVVLDRQGRLRAATPDQLRNGSVLLVPPEISDEELVAIQRSGYTARRSAPMMLASRKAAVSAAEAELDEVTERLRADLRRRHPALFDAAGRLRTRDYARKLSEPARGKKALTREEIVGLGQDSADREDEARALDGP